MLNRNINFRVGLYILHIIVEEILDSVVYFSTKLPFMCLITHVMQNSQVSSIPIVDRFIQLMKSIDITLKKDFRNSAAPS